VNAIKWDPQGNLLASCSDDMTLKVLMKLILLLLPPLITGSIARSAKHRYLIYSEADFEVFHPAGATRCTDGGEIWHGGVRV